MTTVQVLRKARALIKKGWCQGAYARAINGASVDPAHPGAVRFCAMAAISKIAQRHEHRAGMVLVSVINAGICGWNDRHGRTKTQVLAAFDKAIRAASK